MERAESSPDGVTQRTALTAKTIGDLDALVQAVRKALPASKPWQRQLAAQLSEMDRELQVLRLTISLGRPAAEIGDAAAALVRTLRAANGYVSTGRADMATKAAIRLAMELGQRVADSLQATRQK